MTRIVYGSKRQAKVLVVDNEPIIALSLSALLQKQGYKVAIAFSGEEAVAKAEKFSPDLLVSDINMGAMNGVEAATQITAMLPQCGVLFLSGHASMADILHTAPKRLVYSFMSKPMHPLDLLNAIAYILPALSPVDEQALVVMQQEIIERYTNKWMLARNRFPLGATQAGTEIWASVPEHFDAVLRDRIPPGSDYPRVQLQ